LAYQDLKVSIYDFICDGVNSFGTFLILANSSAMRIGVKKVQ